MKRTLADLIEGLNVIESRGDLDFTVRDIVYDSRKVRRGDLFIAIRGEKTDGHHYIVDAVLAGAAAVLVEEMADVRVPQVRVPNTLRAMGTVAARHFDFPADELLALVVTGSNGKTTICYCWESILHAAGRNPGLLGTIEYRWGGETRGRGTTTPLSADLQRYLRQMVNHGVDSVAMEVSSHGIALHRVDHLNPDVACFTNLTPEHLDFHKTMEDYGNTKKRLFTDLLPPGNAAAINIDDPFGARMAEEVHGRRVLRYGLSPKADYRAEDLEFSVDGTAFTLRTPQGKARVHSHLIGHYNVANVLGAAAAALAVDIPMDAVLQGIEQLRRIPGRLEPVEAGQDFKLFVDYAHSPDGVEKVLDTLKALPHGRLLTVVGCGGDRDKTKRPVMARLAAERSDIVILTSDNPRTEDPRQILSEMEGGLKDYGTEYEVIVDRKEAIFRAARLAGPDDVILLAGKGHEDYQILGDRTVAFDDREVARQALKERLGQ